MRSRGAGRGSWACAGVLALALVSCGDGASIEDYRGHVEDAPGRVLMAELGRRQALLHREISGAVDSAEIRRQTASIVELLDWSRKINRGQNFQTNISHCVDSAHAIAAAAEQPDEAAKAVYRLDQACTRCHMRYW